MRYVLAAVLAAVGGFLALLAWALCRVAGRADRWAGR
jgi:hypothetical protein